MESLVTSPRTGLWTIETPVISEAGGISRCESVVGGYSVWYESGTHSLRPSMEAFAGAMLAPALDARIRLDLEDPVDAVWLDGIRRIPPVYARWWGYPEDLPFNATGSRARLSAPGRRRVSCFSGGIDSFFTLLQNRDVVDGILFVEGFDVRLDDAAGLAACRRTLSEVAEEFGKELFLLRSNIREHPLFRSVCWGRTHGGAITAAAHLLGDHAREMIIPSSYSKALTQPCGSHYETDRFHSSGTLTVRHHGEDFMRQEKTAAIYRETVVQRHLRVCWENHTSDSNCSRCEKCLRTRAQLHNLGVLHAYKGFDQSRPVSRRLYEMPYGPDKARAGVWAVIRAHSGDPILRAAVRDYILRPTQEAAQNPLPRLRDAPGAHLLAHMEKWRRRWLCR